MPDESPKRHVSQDDFTIGDWLVEPSLDRLSRAGVVGHLRPQLTDLLLLLARHGGRTVPKHVILGEVWGSEYVGESALTRCIAEIRQAFGDDARQPTIIETIPKRGYRLVAPVVFLPANVPPTISENGRASGGGETHCVPATDTAVPVEGASDEHAGVAIASKNKRTLGAQTRQWPHDVHWKVLFALAIVVVLALAVGRCGPREAAAKRPAEGQPHVHEIPGRPGAMDDPPIVRVRDAWTRSSPVRERERENRAAT